MKVVVLASGNGSNFAALADKLTHGEITLLITDNPRAKVLDRAWKRGIPTAVLPMMQDRAEHDRALAELVRGADLAVLAGYRWLVGPAFLATVPAINVHPSLLPQFPGMHAIRQALHAGVETTGVSVIEVDAGIDTGPILAQRSVPLAPRETLEDRIHAAEHELLPETVDAWLSRRRGRPTPRP